MIAICKSEVNDNNPSNDQSENQAPNTNTETLPGIKLSIDAKYLNTDGTLENVGPVRIDQILDMTTSSDELQITHKGMKKNIKK